MGLTFDGMAVRAVAYFQEKHRSSQPGVVERFIIDQHEVVLAELPRGNEPLELRRWRANITDMHGNKDVTTWITRSDNKVQRLA